MGIDIPVQWYADDSGQMTLDRFAALPADQLATTRQIPSFGYSRKTRWLRSELPGTWFAGEPRWLQLGPSFVDHLTIYYRPLGSDAPRAQRTFGDRDGARESDLHYRESVLILPPPPTAAGYEVVFRLQSTSTLILLASLSSPQEFVQRATADTAFWSFYFGLGRRRQRRGAVAGAGPAPASAVGHLSFLAQLSAGGRPARLPGVVFRPRRAAVPRTS